MEIKKPGLFEQWLDLGTYGLAHLGMAPGGCMDLLAARLVNMLLGKNPNEKVLEMHFPAPVIYFNDWEAIALSGADFGATINGITIPNNRRVLIPPGSELKFKRKNRGERTYLAEGAPTNVESVIIEKTHSLDPIIHKWYVELNQWYAPGPIRVMHGPEWDWLSEDARSAIWRQPFEISKQSNRQGYQLSGKPVSRIRHDELLSSGVLSGTIQLLPNGQPLLLMADAQTTGGYPRILQVAAVDLPRLAQSGAGDKIRFVQVEWEQACTMLREMEQSLAQLESAILLHACY